MEWKRVEHRVDVKELLLDPYLPEHWPKASQYRLRSIKARVVTKCITCKLEIAQIIPYINQATRGSLCSSDNKRNRISNKSLRTYRSTLLRYLAERILNRQLKPWDAKNFFVSSKYINYNNQNGTE